MSDPDADAVMASFDSPSAKSNTGDPDADAVISALGKDTKSSSPATFGRTLLGEAEMLGSGIGNIPHAAAHGAVDLYRRLTGGDTNAPDPAAVRAIQVPTGDAARELVQNVAELPPVAAAVRGAKAADRALETASPTAHDVLHQALDVGSDVASLAPVGVAGKSLVSRVAGSGPFDAQAALNAAASGKSMGAASTAPNITAASPELQEAIANAARKTGGAVNPDVLSRHLEADSLPVKMQLTAGQASQDPVKISQEQNMRGKAPEFAARFNEQNQQLVDNTRAIREAAGPDVFSTNPVEHGDTLIQAYKDKAAVADADISAKYKALRDANGGQFPVDAQALVDSASKQLHQQLLYDHAPKAVMSTLNRLADTGNMTFENFESLRTNLARIQRSASIDGNEKAAAGVIRNAMEQLPLAPGAAKLKPLADTARSAAKAQFDALEADPAYKAAVEGSVSPDRFTQKFIVNAPRDDVTKMRDNLSHDDRATQTMGVAAIDHLRQSAGIDPIGNGNFSQAQFNRQLERLRPKLGALVAPEQADQLDTLGKVARYTQIQPRGSYVNNSNTLVGALADHAASSLEGAANVYAHGVPVGTMVRKGLQNRSTRQKTSEALQPGAGLEDLR